MARSQETVSLIHPTAVVQRGAVLDEGVTVGPFAVIGPGVRMGSGTWVGPHAVVEGRTTVGRGNRIFQFASVGAPPQDLKYKGEDSELVIGDRNTIREFTTVHKGTDGGGGVTRIGDGNLLMAYVHVAHDCSIGNGVIMANAVTLGGHITVEDEAFFGGLSGVHQFCRVGTLAMIAAGSIVVQDVPPYTTVQGDRARLAGLNSVGLERKGHSAEAVAALKNAYRILFRSDSARTEAVKRVRETVPSTPEVERLLAFLGESRRGVVR